MSNKKTTMINDLPEELQKNINRVRDNFIICLVKRAGGRIILPVSEVDLADDLFTMEVVDGDFILTTKARN